MDAATAIRDMISSGELAPGERVPEARMAETLGISRNTLREAFRSLSEEGLITQTPNRGACVAIPTINTIIDIYRVRRLIECQAVAEAMPRHPAIARMRLVVEAARLARDQEDWPRIATANIEFHRAIVELADSPRLNRMYAQLTSELRLAFGMIDDAAYLHAPFLERNEVILALLEEGRNDPAAAALREYLLVAERILLAGYERATEGAALQ
jgi:DNA-binding GntR family transcriptional regulator